jgi:hypothetical protein
MRNSAEAGSAIINAATIGSISTLVNPVLCWQENLNNLLVSIMIQIKDIRSVSGDAAMYDAKT